MLFLSRFEEVSVSLLRFLVENSPVRQSGFRVICLGLGSLLARHEGFDRYAELALFSVMGAVLVIVSVLLVRVVASVSVVYRS